MLPPAASRKITLLSDPANCLVPRLEGVYNRFGPVSFPLRLFSAARARHCQEGLITQLKEDGDAWRSFIGSFSEQ
jgi:hypothetical protein